MNIESCSIKKEGAYLPKIFHFTPTEDCDFIGVSWGNSQNIETFKNIFNTHLLSIDIDSEKTIPFQVNPDLPIFAEQMRIAALMTNSELIQKVNFEEYVFGIEMIGLYFFRGMLYYIQIGQPNLLVTRSGFGTLSLGATLNYQQSNHSDLSILPLDLLGTNPYLSISVHRAPVQKGDIFHLLYGPFLPTKAIDECLDLSDIEKLGALIADKYVDSFWLGRLNLSI